MVGGYDKKDKSWFPGGCTAIPATPRSIPLGRNCPLLRTTAILCLTLASLLAARAQQPRPAKADLPQAPTPQVAPFMLAYNATGPSPQRQSPPEPETTPVPAGTLLTAYPHPDNTWWYFAGQSNIIFQAHPAFHSPYSGPNSFTAKGEYKTSLLGTFFTGFQLNRDPRYDTDLIFDVESSGGRGLSQALGLAGFTNLDVVRNPNLGSAPYIARVEIHQTIGLTSKMVPQERDYQSLATEVPERRFEIRVGKMSLPDVFDLNTVGSDSHLQFTNWTIDNNGAWDYAADTRGYTVGGTIAYYNPTWSFRYGIFAMPTVANGEDLDWAFSRSSGQNWEFDWFHSFLKGRTGSTRILAYVNHAHMGDYKQSIIDYLQGVTPTPEITYTEKFGAVKYGFGWNNEQDITDNLRIFSRVGWDDGMHESYVYTEVDQTVAFGADYRGTRWHRPYDKIGSAFVTNAIKKYHQIYLADGGMGFILGDGHLNYGRENISETYYNMHFRGGVFGAIQLTHIDNPGYNRDRGPVWVPGLRLHVDF